MNRLVGALLVVLGTAALGACTGSPAPAPAPSRGSPVPDPFRAMSQGVCFNTLDGSIESLGYASDPELTDCTGAHDFEYLGVVDYRDKEASEFGRVGTDECLAKYAGYVSTPYDPNGYFNLAVVIPELRDIESGHTDGYCFISARDGATRGVRGSARDTGGTALVLPAFHNPGRWIHRP